MPAMARSARRRRAYFSDNMFGCEPANGITFPDFQRIAAAFGFPVHRVTTHAQLIGALEETLHGAGPQFCEVMIDPRRISRRNSPRANWKTGAWCPHRCTTWRRSSPAKNWPKTCGTKSMTPDNPALAGRQSGDPRRRTRLAACGRNGYEAKADDRDRRPANSLAYHENLCAIRHRGFHHLPRL